ncbi:hypothetical protein K4K58_006857 [Colletotrichum sp. SAR11_239]|nr:hypothetical protein K4K58_006857 [Colletotrichum sp. SAR11_239]
MSPWVNVLFKNPESEDERGRSYVTKDLNRDILAHSPATSSRAWWLASTWIRRMRRPINDVGDILSILRSRSTSKPGDRPIIAALLANVRDVIKLADKSEATLTEEIIRFLGRVPQNALLHGKPTIGNEGEPWDRCPASLDDMPAEIVADMESQRASEIVNTINVSDDGAVDGE